ncbi:META domain-containing protein [Flavihumibacter sp. R14]|nr:META domain-containing protein [Flavihumibacter soli]
MNRILSLLFLLFWAFAGCKAIKSTTDTQVSPALMQQVAASWEGELPCADCEGIAYRLSLKADGSFETHSVYLGKAGTGFTQSGTWQISPDSLITLTPAKGDKFQYAFKGNTLEMLDRNGKKISSGFPELYQLHKTIGESNAALRNEKAIQGVDFLASGNEPAWSLEIDFDRSMHFKTMAGLEITAPSVKGVKAADANVTRYHAETEQGVLTVQLFKQVCTNSMSGEKSAWKVQVSAKKNTDNAFQEFSGCGRFIGNYRLNEHWTLQRIGSTTMTAGAGKKIPFLELNLNEGKASGYGGCNRFTGGFSITGLQISFKPLASTKMACLEDNIEDRFLSLLTSKPLSYKVSDEMLYLGEGEEMLVFKRGE